MQSTMNRRQFLKKSAQITFALLGTASLSGAYSRWIEPYWIEVNHVNITLSTLPPAFNHFRIVHFSDLHHGFHSKPEHLSELVEQVGYLQPELICFTGDLLDRSTEYLSDAVSLFSQLQAPFGQYAVLGNHDAYGTRKAVTKGLPQAGFHILNNEHVVLTKGDDRLYIAGVDDPWVGKPDIDQSTTGLYNTRDRRDSNAHTFQLST